MERVRVDLAAHRRTAPASGARAELVEQTPVGEELVAGLMRAQLGLAVRFAALVVVVFGSIPLLFALVPSAAQVRVAGIALPWLLLGVLSFPFLVLVGHFYTRLAERNETDFAALIGRPEERA